MKIYTIKDIARKAGVSVTTVSRVLNKRPDVNQATREKVERVMAECRFVGNANARGLKQPDGDLIASSCAAATIPSSTPWPKPCWSIPRA